jgi:hypothetical protein
MNKKGQTREQKHGTQLRNTKKLETASFAKGSALSNVLLFEDHY